MKKNKLYNKIVSDLNLVLNSIKNVYIKWKKSCVFNVADLNRDRLNKSNCIIF